MLFFKPDRKKADVNIIGQTIDEENLIIGRISLKYLVFFIVPKDAKLKLKLAFVKKYTQYVNEGYILTDINIIDIEKIKLSTNLTIKYEMIQESISNSKQKKVTVSRLLNLMRNWKGRTIPSFETLEQTIQLIESL